MKLVTWMTTYTLIILAELGDKTQIATLILASNNPRKRWVIFGAAASALSACVLLEVTIGAYIARYLSQETINKLTGVVFLIIGVFTLFKQYALSKRWKMVFGILPKLTIEKETESVGSGKA